MAYDEKLAASVRQILAQRSGVTEQPMFGGICFMLRGNMLCGVNRDRLMFRVGKEQDAEALARPGARPMDITGKRMVGFVFVDPAACDKRALGRWVELAEGYVGTLPPKVKAATKGKTRRASSTNAASR